MSAVMVASAQIPVIDIDASGDDAEQRVANALVDAAVKFGFVYIKSTAAIAADVVQRTFSIVNCMNRSSSHSVPPMKTLTAYM
jgi:isopenicillin N synthase-like dioxygenase